MAVEAPHMSLFPSQFLTNRDMMNQPNATTYENRFQTAYGMAPMPETKSEKMIPMNGGGMMDFPTTAFKADSGLTSNLPNSRKRIRYDQSTSFNPPFSFQKAQVVNQNELNRHHISTFPILSEDMDSRIYQQQLEIDRFISHHTENVRTEIEEIQRRNSRRLIAGIEEGIMKRLKAKEDEILKIGQLNWSLEEKVKSLNIENQIWKELAQSNEATANALRNNLQQVLAHLDFTDNPSKSTPQIDDAQSHCGSNYDESHDQRTLADNNGGERKCRNCGKKESCVLLLPCRHLCVCNVCNSSITFCPVCKSTKSAGVLVNMN